MSESLSIPISEWGSSGVYLCRLLGSHDLPAQMALERSLGVKAAGTAYAEHEDGATELGSPRILSDICGPQAIFKLVYNYNNYMV